jgi:hypothetical protein
MCRHIWQAYNYQSKAAWYGDSEYLYTSSNTTEQALGWTKDTFRT